MTNDKIRVDQRIVLTPTSELADATEAYWSSRNVLAEGVAINKRTFDSLVKGELLEQVQHGDLKVTGDQTQDLLEVALATTCYELDNVRPHPIDAGYLVTLHVSVDLGYEAGRAFVGDVQFEVLENRGVCIGHSALKEEYMPGHPAAGPEAECTHDIWS